LSNIASLSVTKISLSTSSPSNTNEIVWKPEIKYTFYNLKNHSFIHDRKNQNGGQGETNISSTIDHHFVNKLGRKGNIYNSFRKFYFSLAYCDIVSRPRQNWIPARRYVESNIGYLV
jgi:hypothetical protein